MAATAGAVGPFVNDLSERLVIGVESAHDFQELLVHSSILAVARMLPESDQIIRGKRRRFFIAAAHGNCRRLLNTEDAEALGRDDSGEHQSCVNRPLTNT